MVYSLEDLKKAYSKGQRYKFLFFWGHTPDPGGHITEACLSQWWMAPFDIDGITYSCAEQFMMAEKARMFKDQEMLSRIMEARQPKDIVLALHQKQDTGGGKPKGPHLGHWHGKKQSRRPVPIKMEGHEPSGLCPDRGQGYPAA